MKKLLTFAALAAIASLGFTGCETASGVDNPDDSTGYYNMGAFTTRYTAKSQDYIENVFNATKKGLDQLGYYRTGETPSKDKVTVFARAHGDVQITVDIFKKVIEAKDGSKSEWVYVAIRYGTWGNLKESQQIASKISANLFQK